MNLLQNSTLLRRQSLFPTILSGNALERLNGEIRRAESLLFGLSLSCQM